MTATASFATVPPRGPGIGNDSPENVTTCAVVLCATRLLRSSEVVCCDFESVKLPSEAVSVTPSETVIPVVASGEASATAGVRVTDESSASARGSSEISPYVVAF